MDVAKILKEIDALESKLRLVRSILTGEHPATPKKNVGRPKKATVVAAPKKKRVISKAGREAIAAAQKKRWAATKKAEIKK